MDSLFLTVNSWMSGSLGLAGLGAFLWGLISVLFSPCHLASIPLIVGYVAGQGKIIEGRQAAGYALCFSGGLFLSIALIGLICSLLGRILGDVGPYWTIPVGALLLYVGLDMLGLAKSLFSGSLISRLKVRGMGGALVLGLSYGVLSGSCTFGFIAPILAIATLQERLADALVLICLFAFGHCLPILAAGSFAGLARRWLESGAAQGAMPWFRKGSGALISFMGLYFMARPLL